ncbi:hypothetical protein OG897_16330 [Streptomyces sp. NBC_00237]|uniref:hypothetical protein n=1 Tax=Streptomyces sp. NBC_00237 TaxID=2975687 RepID=UPI002259A4A9|nr:hypothetical protein [Streptomyces sp. NBC_00237]MCX5203009.1 hypothetical protein [Streptomyces sp. NBC_00237]
MTTAETNETEETVEIEAGDETPEETPAPVADKGPSAEEYRATLAELADLRAAVEKLSVRPAVPLNAGESVSGLGAVPKDVREPSVADLLRSSLGR